MKSKALLEQKKNHDRIMNIKKRMSKGEPTTFYERNIARIYTKRMMAKRKKMISSLT
jgi:hypothetical protein